MLTITIPGKPVAQGRPRFARRGIFVVAYDPATSKDYKSWVRHCALQAMAGVPPIPRDVPLIMDVRIVLDRPKSIPKKVVHAVKKPDVDNYVKGLSDALESIVYEADQQIVELHAAKVYGTPPGVTVTITRKDENNA